MKRARSVVRCELVTTAMMTLWAMGSRGAGSENAAVAGASSWVLSAAAPGPDVPPAGASLFDRITTLPAGRREVPLPYEKLIQRFEAAAGCSATASCVRSVLLPLGRSSQRVAASPDYFRFPRIVSGVAADGRGPWWLRDRLYVGFVRVGNNCAGCHTTAYRTNENEAPKFVTGRRRPDTGSPKTL